MINNSYNLFELLKRQEQNRSKGEISSKKGRDYEDKASFYILERFHNLFKLKNKITSLSFNGIEDLDIFDDNDKIFSFQIKKNKNLWEKNDPRIIEFLQRCIKRYFSLKSAGISNRIKYFFLRIKMENF